MEIHVRDLPRPASTVVANWVSVERVGPEVELIFGQLVRRERRLNAALVITMPVSRLVEIVSPGAFIDSLAGFALAHGLTADVPAPAISMPPERIVFERATVALFAQSDHEAEARFFHVPPAEASPERRSPRDRVLGIVTVTMPTSLLWYLCRQLQELAR